MSDTPKGFAQQLRRDSTWFERKLWSRLRARQVIGSKVRRQHPFGRCVLDFYCAERKLNVELDGDQHGHPEGIDRDCERERFLERNGVRTLRFANHEITENLDGVLETICAALEEDPPHPNPLPRWGEGTGGATRP